MTTIYPEEDKWKRSPYSGQEWNKSDINLISLKNLKEISDILNGKKKQINPSPLSNKKMKRKTKVKKVNGQKVKLDKYDGQYFFTNAIEISADVYHTQAKNNLFNFELKYSMVCRFYTRGDGGLPCISIGRSLLNKKDYDEITSSSSRTFDIPKHIPKKQHGQYVIKFVSKEENFLDNIVKPLSIDMIFGYVVKEFYIDENKQHIKIKNFQVKELKYG